jgi:hypothetical protein
VSETGHFGVQFVEDVADGVGAGQVYLDLLAAIADCNDSERHALAGGAAQVGDARVGRQGRVKVDSPVHVG